MPSPPGGRAAADRRLPGRRRQPAARPWRCTATSATATSRPGLSTELGVLQRLTGDYPAAAASHQQALELFRDLGDRAGQAHALNELGLVQQLTGDYPAAAASHQQALDAVPRPRRPARPGRSAEQPR